MTEDGKCPKCGSTHICMCSGYYVCHNCGWDQKEED